MQMILIWGHKIYLCCTAAYKKNLYLAINVPIDHPSKNRAKKPYPQWDIQPGIELAIARIVPIRRLRRVIKKSYDKAWLIRKTYDPDRSYPQSYQQLIHIVSNLLISCGQKGEFQRSRKSNTMIRVKRSWRQRPSRGLSSDCQNVTKLLSLASFMPD